MDFIDSNAFFDEKKCRSRGAALSSERMGLAPSSCRIIRSFIPRVCSLEFYAPIFFQTDYFPSAFGLPLGFIEIKREL